MLLSRTLILTAIFAEIKNNCFFSKKYLIFLQVCGIISDTVFGIRGCGGIGRRAGFRCQWQQCRVGSSPVIRTRDIEVWLSLVERCVRDAEAVGSSPVTSTKIQAREAACRAVSRFSQLGKNGFVHYLSIIVHYF